MPVGQRVIDCHFKVGITQHGKAVIGPVQPVLLRPVAGEFAYLLFTAGIVLFSYDALVAPPNNAGTVIELGRAAFGAGSH